MTKEIQLPFTSEGCNRIKIGVCVTLLILGIIGGIYMLIGYWFDWFGGSHQARMVNGVIVGLLLTLGIGSLLCYAHDKGVWVEFKYKCNKEEYYK